MQLLRMGFSDKMNSTEDETPRFFLIRQNWYDGLVYRTVNIARSPPTDPSTLDSLLFLVFPCFSLFFLVVPSFSLFFRRIQTCEPDGP